MKNSQNSNLGKRSHKAAFSNEANGNEGNKKLVIKALKNSNLKEVKKLIDSGYDVNIQDEYGYQLIYRALSEGSMKVFDWLRKSGKCNLKAKNINKSTLLHLAVTTHQNTVIDNLIKAGCDLDIQDYDGNTPLHRAMYACNIIAAKKLIAAGCKLDIKNNNGNTPLLLAIVEVCEDGNIGLAQVYKQMGSKVKIPLLVDPKSVYSKLVKCLIKAKCGLDIKNKDGYTAIHLALDLANTIGAKKLIAAGCDLDIKDKDGYTAIHTALCQGMMEVYYSLFKSGKYNLNEETKNKTTLLHLAVMRHQNTAVYDLINAKFDLDIKDKDGYTPLHRAIYTCNIIAAKKLIVEGCKSDIKNNDGDTPLHLTLSKTNQPENIGLAETGYFKKPGCKINTIFKNIEDANIELAEDLITAGCDVNAKNKNGDTALHLAIEIECIARVNLLLGRKDINLDQANKKGLRPLDNAIFCNNFHIVDLLIKRGADISILSDYLTVEHAVKKNEYGDIINHQAYEIRQKVSKSLKIKTKILKIAKEATSKEFKKLRFIEEENKIVKDSYEEIAKECNYFGEEDQVKKGGEIMDTNS